MSKHERDYRVGVCGWPANCFDAAGNQLYTPQELERLAQADDRSCPAGICIAARGDSLTGAHARSLAHAQALEAETTARLAVLTQGSRHQHQAAQPEVKTLPDGGSWVTIGGADIRQGVPTVKVSLWDLLTGKA